MTRTTDTQRVFIDRRIQIAKDFNATYFLSVHHNGFPLAVRGSEVWWSGRDTTDSGAVRVSDARDSILTKKVLTRHLERWHYPDHCASQNPSDWMAGCDGKDNSRFYILNNLPHCCCCLSEASNINDYTEEYLFSHEWTGHLDAEASSIYHGAHSHSMNMGFARISNRYIGGPGYIVAIDGFEWQTPVELTWEAFEQHELIAAEHFRLNDYDYYFHHWCHLLCDDCFIDSSHISRFYDVWVPPEFEEHIYRAYFTGGYYACNVNWLPFPNRYAVGDSVFLNWWTTAGVDSTAEVTLRLDRHNGRDGYPEVLAADVPWKETGSINWVVTGPDCDSCILTVASHDVAGNNAVGFTEYLETFRICSWRVGDADGNGGISIADISRLIDYIFSGGPPPAPHQIGSGDSDCNGAISLADAVILINWMFMSGPPPGQYCSCADYD